MQNQSKGRSEVQPQALASLLSGTLARSLGLRQFTHAFAGGGSVVSVLDAVWLRNAIAVGCVLVAGYLLAQLTWVWLEGVSLPVPEKSRVMSSASRAATAGPQTLSVLTSTDPFFHTPESEIDSTSVQSSAPETNLDLRLFGIRAGSGNGANGAIIRTPDGEQRAFQEGQSLIDGVTLESIFPDRVILSRSGTRESLYLMPREKRSDGTPTQLSRSMSNEPGDELTISSLLATIRLEPRIHDGRIDGFFVAPSTPAALLEKSGLNLGDVIMAVNNVRLVSAERITDVVEELRTAREARVEIERDGDAETLLVSVGGGRP